MILVARADPRVPDASALLQKSHAMLVKLFPAEANHHLSIDGLCSPDIAFFTATRCKGVVGVGALADRGTYGEVKSVFVAPDARGMGVASAILAAIEAEAHARAHSFLRLETGPNLHAALRLYRREGFVVRGPFGGYRDDPLSVFMEKAVAR